MNTRILASLMVIGIAAAVAGGSTFALFNDTETSESNVFTAGAIDLKIDWNETYNGVDMGSQNLTDNPGSIFNLDDIKPGDEGEATISLHVYDNPGYIWMRMQPVLDDDSGNTEPELEVDDPDDPQDDFDGELRENLLFTLWYDDGDNIYEPENGEQLIEIGGDTQICRPGEEVDVGLVLDVSTSMDTIDSGNQSRLDAAKEGSELLIDSLNNTDQSALVAFSSSATLEQELTTNKTEVKNAVDALSTIGSTNIGSGISAAHTELINGTNARANATKVMVVLSDGSSSEDPVPESEAAQADGVRVITIALGTGADTQTLEDVASSSDDAYVAETDDLNTVFTDISGAICSPGSDLETGILLDADPDTDEVEAFANSTTRYIGFMWELPLNVGNEAQTDSFVANLDFYAEQERNNPAPQNPWN